MAKAKRPGIGHNSDFKTKLKSIVSRIESVEEEKRGLTEDIKELYTEAKDKGFDTKVIRFIVAQRRKDREELREFQELYEQYLFALDPELADVLS